MSGRTPPELRPSRDNVAKLGIEPADSLNIARRGHDILRYLEAQHSAAMSFLLLDKRSCSEPTSPDTSPIVLNRAT